MFTLSTMGRKWRFHAATENRTMKYTKNETLNENINEHLICAL